MRPPMLVMEYLAIPGGRYDAVSFGDQAGFPAVGFTTLNQMFEKLVRMIPLDQTERGLVLAILKEHYDPNRRLVYADWLEENGREEEANAERFAARALDHRERMIEEMAARRD